MEVRNNGYAGRPIGRIWIGYHNLISLDIYIWLGGRVAMQRPAKPWTPVRFRLQPPFYFVYVVILPNARVVELVDTRDLSKLSTQVGNTWCEWSQIRGNLST